MSKELELIAAGTVLSQHSMAAAGRIYDKCRCGWYGSNHAEHQLSRLSEHGYSIVQVPEVGFKGHGETDADRYHEVALNVERGHYVGGSNSRTAVALLLRRVSDALSAAAAAEEDQ